MKIIVVSDYAKTVGGAYKIAIMSAIAFAERGFDVEFFAGNAPIGPVLASHPEIKVTCLGDFPHTRDPKRLRGAVRGLWYRRSARVMREILARCDRHDTIVHLHAYRETLTTSVASVATRMGFATIYTAHEYTMGCPYGGFFDYRANRICTLTGLSPACLKTRCNTSGYGNKLWYFLSQFVYAKVCRIPRKLSHTVFLSKLNQTVLFKYLPRDARHTIVPNPSEEADPSMPLRRIPGPFLFIGALEPHKDPVTAARAAQMLGAPITFVGSGSLEAEIKRECPGAVVTGWIDSAQVSQRLLEGRALLFPSIWYEALPCTTMEAASAGVPIIVSDASAAVEQVEQLRVGEVFKAGDVAALVEKMRPYLDNDYASKQGAETKAAFDSLDLGADHHIASLLEIYRAELSRLV